MGVKYIKQCKVCNSKFRNLIEELHTQNMSPQKIYEYLQNSKNPEEQAVITKEDIGAASIRRHMDKHYDIKDEALVKLADTKSRIEKSRESYKQGVSIFVDQINSLSHMIDVAMVKMEEVDTIPGEKTKHSLTLQYMTTIRGLIESLAKLTGDLKQEGTIDVNFFSGEITKFADLVLASVREVDKQLGLNNQLEYYFAAEFKKQWDAYQTRQNKILSGELSTSDGEKEARANTFNEGS